MAKIKIISAIILVLMAIIMTTYAILRIEGLKKENTRLVSNQEILLTQKEVIMAESQIYKVSDSLNAAKVSELQLTLREYKKYRSQDLQLIKKLKTKGSDLQKIIDSQAETINSLSAKLNDSIVVVDTTANMQDTLKCFDYKSKWTDVSGCMDLRHDSVSLQVKSRESLKIVETIIYKRFLGFLWKTKKIKDRQVDVVSENPCTAITNVDYISIEL